MREVVPQQRLRRSWVINRTVRTSNTWSRMRLALTTRPAERLRTRVERSARGGYRLLRGTARVCRGQIVDDVVDQALGSVYVASGRGLLLGAFGGTGSSTRGSRRADRPGTRGTIAVPGPGSYVCEQVLRGRSCLSGVSAQPATGARLPRRPRTDDRSATSSRRNRGTTVTTATAQTPAAAAPTTIWTTPGTSR